MKIYLPEIDLKFAALFFAICCSTFFYFPFVFRYFGHSVYALLTVGSCLLLLILSIIVVPKNHYRALVYAFVSLFALKMLVITAATLWSGRSFGDALSEIIRLTSICTLFFLFNSNRSNLVSTGMFFITNVFIIFGLIGFTLGLVGYVVPVDTVYLDTSQGEYDSGYRLFSMYGLHWMRLPELGEQVFRLQSFTSEAGNLAMVISVSIIYCHVIKPKYYRTILIINYLSLIATFSFSAYVSLFLIYFIRKKLRALFYSFLIAIFIAYIGYLLNYGDFLEQYLVTKYDGGFEGETSLGLRFEQLKFFFDAIFQCGPIGCGVSSSSFLGMTLAIGWLNVFVNTGIFFGIVYFGFFFFVLVEVIRRNRFMGKHELFLGLCFVYLFIQGFFRGEPFSSAWYMIYLAPLVVYLSNEENWYER